MSQSVKRFEYQIQPTRNNKLKVQIDTGIQLEMGTVKVNQTVPTRRDAVSRLQEYLQNNPGVDFSCEATGSW
ncbi:MAG: hypothetical protein AAGF01_18195 [Cyanobacteria bacterium P01_G01_bin.38]